MRRRKRTWESGIKRRNWYFGGVKCITINTMHHKNKSGFFSSQTDAAAGNAVTLFSRSLPCCYFFFFLLLLLYKFILRFVVSLLSLHNRLLLLYYILMWYTSVLAMEIDSRLHAHRMEMIMIIIANCILIEWLDNWIYHHLHRN